MRSPIRRLIARVHVTSVFNAALDLPAQAALGGHSPFPAYEPRLRDGAHVPLSTAAAGRREQSRATWRPNPSRRQSPTGRIPEHHPNDGPAARLSRGRGGPARQALPLGRASAVVVQVPEAVWARGNQRPRRSTTRCPRQIELAHAVLGTAALFTPAARTVSVPACLRRLQFAAVCCSVESGQLQADSVCCSLLPPTRWTLNPKVAGSIPARPMINPCKSSCFSPIPLS